ncbi:hypothetical protein GIB67_001410 [Kingdonia uniflora]|uniref:BZIP domain-containing protein n=1 Tax=Kingdonia uniflora TaxID=39325 RepID=A0A7J7N7P6_9MAGN|nr:hypothetical protein GIB67_001410 [Kingdonia uniflora]
MASSSGNSSGCTGSEEDPKLMLDERKHRRMQSNRESARRSRQRKQKYLDGLTSQLTQLRKENNQILGGMKITTQHYVNIESENSVLRAQMGELSHRLHSLNEIVQVLDVNYDNGGFESENCVVNPWNSLYVNHHPIVVSADMLEY